MLTFTEATEKLGKEQQAKQERARELCHKLSCDWQNNGKTEYIFRCTAPI